MSHWGTTRLVTFRKALDAWLEPKTTCNSRPPNTTSRNLATRIFENLGHCGIDYEQSLIEIAPPVLARLPIRGLPQAIMCGFRTRDYIDRLKKTVYDQGKKCLMRTDNQRNSLAPQRITIEAESWGDLDVLAQTLGILAPIEPPALSLIDFSPSINQIEDVLDWKPLGDINWPRRDFNPDLLHFTSENQNDVFRLSRFLDPVRMSNTHYLRRGSDTARCDRSWGRYIILSYLHRDIIGYNPHLHYLTVPVGIPLPTALGRAVTLCTGFAPRLINSQDMEESSMMRLGLDVYLGISHSIAERVAGKVGQKLVDMPRDLLEEERNA